MSDAAEIEGFRHLIEELSRDSACRELLGFLGKHSYTRFGRLALLETLGLECAHRTEKTLHLLVLKGLVCTSGDGLLYWLTREEPLHSLLKATFELSRGVPAQKVGWTAAMQLPMPLVPCVVTVAP